MSKSLLLIDTPACCDDCPLKLWDALSEYYGACVPTLKEVNSVTDEYKENEDRDTIPSWCPLKPLPRKKNKDFHPNIVYANGWNDCLNEILRRQDDEQG